jgi:Flp pilus assembly protein TadG
MQLNRTRGSFRRHRRGVVALLFAIMAIPILGMLGLAIDFGLWNQTYSSLALAASSASLNAARIAASAFLNNDASYAAEGQTAAQQWFLAALSAPSYAATSSTLTTTVSVTTSSTAVTVTITYAATVPSIFGKLFSFASYPVASEAVASQTIAPFTEVVMLLDNSSSMDIAASVSGINQLMTLSACDPTNAFYDPTGSTSPSQWTNQTLNPYGNYQLTYNGTTFDGSSSAGITLSPAVADPVPVSPYPAKVANEHPTGTLTGTNGSTTFTVGAPYVATSSATGQTCKGVLPKQSNGQYPLPGPPCAFACHWTNTASTDARGGTADLFGLARRNNIQLRFDLVKNATNTVLSAMNSDNISSINNLSAGIYTFNTGVTQIYPSNCTPQAAGCEAGSNFTAAEAAVGTPPTYPSVTDTGIQPVLGGLTGNNDDTAFPEAMNTLAGSYVTAGGDGTAAAKAKKVLILITDGFQDDPNTGARQAFDPSYCTQFKNMGYTVYVLYTPYYPVVHIAYLIEGWSTIVQGTGTTSISYNLQACASTSADYVAATDQSSINTALLAFLKDALNAPARFTQ